MAKTRVETNKEITSDVPIGIETAIPEAIPETFLTEETSQQEEVKQEEPMKESAVEEKSIDDLAELRQNLINVGVKISGNMCRYERSTAGESDLQTITILCNLYVNLVNIR